MKRRLPVLAQSGRPDSLNECLLSGEQRTLVEHLKLLLMHYLRYGYGVPSAPIARFDCWL